ncbi:hypothetical protein TWF481_005666 [Arthrobotrys musiformis]|uniref:Peroxin/Ferlin domain-containing protein n=1 Tax=Arthrobotrys musiformis TaxID=47236 RepID=A0AAV9WFL2_9PEZI
MSVRGFTLHSQRTHESDTYDHFITLKDNTLPIGNGNGNGNGHSNGNGGTPPGPNLSRATTNFSSENYSPVASTTVSRVQSISSLNDRVGTFNTTTGTFASANSGNSPTSAYVPGHKRKESLRKHLAERKYHREWKQDHNNTIGEASGKSSSNSSDTSSSDEEIDRAQRPNGKDSKKIKRIDSRRYKEEIDKVKGLPTAVLTKKDEIQSKGTRAFRKAKKVGRKLRKEELVDDAGELDILYENQRGTFLFGIPMFSAKSLLPVDSAPWTTRQHAPSAVNIFTAQVPDPSWIWAWKSFAVDMTGDVDEEGWQYSFAFRGTKWHGNAVWWHGFVRRRRWIRKRVQRRLPADLDDAHHLTPEYFTIHSRNASHADRRSGYYSSSIRSIERNSKLEEYPTATQESDDSEFEEYEIQDIPTLMRAFKMARLDREKVEAVGNFLQHGGSEVIYLAENIPKIMRSMIFQQSRRQILQILLDTLNKSNDKRQSRNLENGFPKQEPEDYDDDEEKRFIDGIGRAVDAGEEEVRKLEFWSDIKKAQHQGYAGVENSHHHHHKGPVSPDGSDYEYANIWKARSNFINKRKEHIAGKARGDFAERDESDRSTLESRDTDIGSVTAKEKGKGKATD